MNSKSYNNKFLVYIHTSPNGKRYVGITSKTPQERWGAGGNAYKDNIHFWNAIQKYGWNNFQHDIVATDLSLDDACALEIQLISEYHAMDPNYGYNHTTGGNYSIPDEETRKRLSRAIRKSRKEHPEINEKISKSLQGHPTSDETREKISKALQGTKHSEEFCQKQRARRHTEETLNKLRGQVGWSRGLTKDTDPRVRKISESRKGVKMTDSAKEKLSIKQKSRYADGYDPMWINNGSIETSIQRGSEIPEGFSVGRLNKLDTYVYKGDVSKKIAHDELDNYISDGWQIGRPATVGQAIQKGAQRMHYEYDGQRFETSESLAFYLRSHGYPKIVASTITSLCNKGFEKSPTYKSLAGRVVRVRHEDKIDT